jgi:hypothetical protein
MAKITSPCHSLSASGSLAGVITFRQTKGGSVATVTPHPYPQTSQAQLTNQQVMRDARAAFLSISATDAGHWHTLALTRKRSAWSCFFSEYHYQHIQPPNAPLIPEAIL